MSTHPGRDVLLAHVDGELPESEELAVAAHVAGCAACSQAVSGIRDSAVLFAGVLQAIDDEEPPAWSASTRDYAGDERSDRPAGVLPLRLDGPRAAPTASRASSAFRWAAGIVLVSVAGVSAAIVGYRMQAEPESELIAPAPADAQVEPGVASLVMTPRDGMLRVALSGAGAGSRVYVTLADGEAARIAVEGAESPRFTAATGRVDVDLGADVAMVRVTLPATLRETIVTAAGVALVTIRQDSISPATAATTGIPLDAVLQPRME
jgi:anti-sigma factor RsiW